MVLSLGQSKIPTNYIMLVVDVCLPGAIACVFFLAGGRCYCLWAFSYCLIDALIIYLKVILAEGRSYTKIPGAVPETQVPV